MNNYKLLPALISLLQTRNLTESARQLHVTQSAMSKTLSQIREAFGDPILIREANRFVLTRRGEVLKSQLPSLMQQLDSLYLPDSVNLENCQRRFTFASSDYVAQAVYPAVCKQLYQLAPKASVEYRLWQQDALTSLADSALDVISTITDEVPENLYGEAMAEDLHVVVMRKSHPLADKSMSIEQYVKAKHVVITGGGDKDGPVERKLAELGRSREIFARVPFFQSAIELLLITDTLLTTPLHIAADFAQRYELQLCPLPLDLKAHQYYLLWHAKHHQDPEHRWFRELCLPALTAHLQDTIEAGMKLIHAK